MSEGAGQKVAKPFPGEREEHGKCKGRGQREEVRVEVRWGSHVEEVRGALNGRTRLWDLGVRGRGTWG